MVSASTGATSSLPTEEDIGALIESTAGTVGGGALAAARGAARVLGSTVRVAGRFGVAATAVALGTTASGGGAGLGGTGCASSWLGANTRAGGAADDTGGAAGAGSRTMLGISLGAVS